MRLESGVRADYVGAKRRKGSKVHMAVDTQGHLLALHVTPTNEQDRDQVTHLTRAIQETTGMNIKVAVEKISKCTSFSTEISKPISHRHN